MAGRLTRRSLFGAATVGGVAAVVGVGPRTVGTAAEAVHDGDRGRSRSAVRRHDRRMLELEGRHDVRLGVYALNTGTGAVLSHRGHERFAFCSVFKALATACVLHGDAMSHLDDVVHFTEDDLMPSSFVTRHHVDTGMTIGALCDAAVRYSDGTAGNLLLADLGGPRALTAYARLLGDRTTRMDRVEPHLTTAFPGDPRDTSSPRALAGDFDALVLGRALPREKRAFLRDLLDRSTTGSARIRAALPRGWTMGNKTGTGDHGTANDVAVVRPPDGPPLVVAIMSRRDARGAEIVEDAVAEAAERVFAAIA